VRLGFGPSGEAASERRTIEVPDVFADDDLEDWQEVASELGFRALIALPLQTGSRVLGAVTFYFADAESFSSEKRGLLRILADQMAATAEKALLIDQLRRSNAALVEANEELERQYAAVLQARRLKDEFLANVSHELRTPLTAVLGYISIMQEGISGPLTDGQRNDLTHVKRASERLLDLIENLIELTTLKRGELDVFVEEIDPRQPLREAVASVAPAPGVTIRVEEPTTVLPTIWSDRKKIFRILVSLLGNAVKFTDRGEIVVGVSLANDRLVYRVQDSGIGIAPEVQQFVFDEFRQGDGSPTRRYGGSGLGLALARRLVQLLGGTIEMRSTLGAGSTFTIELPFEYDAPVAAGGT
jgi:signal transduction histidine kinase